MISSVANGERRNHRPVSKRRTPEAHLDTAHLARQGSVHLNFAAPSGKVLSLAGQGNGPVVDPAPADETQKNAKLVKLQHKGP